MKTEQPLNAHNKSEFSLAQISTSDASSIVMYTTEDNSIQLDVKLEGETVWLSQQQMVLLFGRDKSVISRHIKNIFEEGELDKSLVCANFATPKKYGRQEGYEQIQYVDYYNIDVIISVGYRVKSVQGTRFRQWANKVLKDYLIKGYAVNQNITLQHYDELKKVVQLMSRTYQHQEELSSEEAGGMINAISDYAYALDTLDHAVWPEWPQAHCRQHAGGDYADDCRKQAGRKGCHCESGSESDQSGQPITLHPCNQRTTTLY